MRKTDVCFTEDYGRMYENHEGAALQQFTFANEDGKVQYMFLMREIPWKVNGITYYDIVTPYGFGGPIIFEAGNTERLLTAFYDRFHEFCVENNIVAEFVRFHPLQNVKERELFPGYIQSIGKQVIRDLRQPMTENISKSVRREYRLADRHGLVTEFDTTGKDYETFLELYYATMDRNGSSGYYYFSADFFKNLHRTLPGRFFYTYVKRDGETLNAGLQLFGDTYSYAFLGGTAEGAYKYHGNVKLEIDTMNYMKDRGLSYYLMGGGHGKEDGIYNFKKKFVKDSDYDYHVGKRIHHSSVYHTLTAQREKREGMLEESYFPAYRAPVVEKTAIAQFS